MQQSRPKDADLHLHACVSQLFRLQILSTYMPIGSPGRGLILYLIMAPFEFHLPNKSKRTILSPKNAPVKPAAWPPTPSSPHLYPPPPYQPPSSQAEPQANTVHTRYISMLLSLDTIPRTHNILASVSTWILLAGFLIVPGTFTSLQKNAALAQAAAQNVVVGEVWERVQYVPLLWISGACGVLGLVGVGGMWWRWRGNYIWLVGKLFLPLLLNSSLGLLSTVLTVYTQHDGHFSPTALMTLVVTAACALGAGLLYGLYNFLVLGVVRRRHAREVGGKERAEQV